MSKKIASIVFLAISAAGCSSIKHIYARMFYDFETLETNEKIKYERDAKLLALKAGQHYEDSITKVKKAFNNDFQNPVILYVFSDKERFANFSNGSKGARASGSHEGAYLSPRMQEEIETLPGVITHEFVHTYLQQLMGPRRYSTELPAWFQEGIAVIISEGSGTEGVNKNEVIERMLNGNTFVADNKKNLFSTKHPKNIKSREFYYQGSLFVEHIIERDPGKFLVFIDRLEKKSFNESINEVFQADLYEIWQQFLGGLVEYNKSLNQIGAKDAPPS
jgi:hypothetical protein